jgi:hypothetical protein
LRKLLTALPRLRQTERRREVTPEEKERLASGEMSDGYHTHNELYQYRMLYNVLALHGFMTAGWHVTRSWRHHSGEECFGGDWFVVHAETPTGQITNHYRGEHWNLFAGIPEVETSPKWDRHTPPVAAQRLEAAVPILRAQLKKQRAREKLLQTAYEDACKQRDKYMRRTIQWREAATKGTSLTTACTGCGQCDYCTRAAGQAAID